jgi:RNA polymerase sigma factor (sigma-70 family)
MAGRSGAVLGHLYKLLATRGADDQSDGQLLGRFVTQQEEDAFATLVQRHGPLVLSVCRRLLAHTQDVEDAFQATFLVLVRKARALDQRGSLAGWLYGVAYRIAIRARAQAARRRAHERQAAHMQTEKAVPEPADLELRELLDEELSRLPEKYRSPVVLCYLEGKTHAEAARELQWPLGTVRGRVARARDLLRRRLVRRGLALPTGLVASVLASGAVSAEVPTVLATATVRAALLAAAGKVTAAGAFSAPATALGEAVLKELFVAKLKTVLAVLLALTVASTGAGILTYQAVRESVPAQVEHRGEVPKSQGNSQVSAPTPTVLYRHEHEVRSVAFSPDGKTLASASVDADIRLWDFTTARERHPQVQTHRIFTVAFLADGKLPWETAPGHDLLDLATHGHGVWCLACSPQGAVLAAAGPDLPIHVGDLEKGRKLRKLDEHGRGVACLALPPDRTKLASAEAVGTDYQVRLWDARTGDEVRVFKGHQARVTAVAFFPDGKHLVSGSADQTVRLWEVSTGREVRQCKGHAKAVFCLALSSDGTTLVSGSDDQTIRFWEAATGKERRPPAHHPSAVTALALSRDGTMLASGDKGGSVLFWKLDGKK